MTKRIQRKRIKGWRMPEDTVYVGRGSKWGNPHRAGEKFVRIGRNGDRTAVHVADRAHAVRLYRPSLSSELRAAARAELRGKDLACRCSLDQPCHADVLLKIANGTVRRVAGDG